MVIILATNEIKTAAWIFNFLPIFFWEIAEEKKL
jgi:hypothetical protein